MASAEAQTSPLARIHRALLRASKPGKAAAGLAVAGVGVQIVAFLVGFRAATAAPASPAWSRLATVVGLAATVGVLTLLARLVDEGWLPAEAALGFLAFGGFAGGITSVYLVSGTVGPAGELYLYTVVELLYGALLSALLWLAAGVAHRSGHPWWRSLLAAPVLLYTGAHGVLLTSLLLQAGTLAEAAALVPFVGA